MANGGNGTLIGAGIGGVLGGIFGGGAGAVPGAALGGSAGKVVAGLNLFGKPKPPPPPPWYKKYEGLLLLGGVGLIGAVVYFAIRKPA